MSHLSFMCLRNRSYSFSQHFLLFRAPSFQNQTFYGTFHMHGSHKQKNVYTVWDLPHNTLNYFWHSIEEKYVSLNTDVNKKQLYVVVKFLKFEHKLGLSLKWFCLKYLNGRKYNLRCSSKQLLILSRKYVETKQYWTSYV